MIPFTHILKLLVIMGIIALWNLHLGRDRNYKNSLQRTQIKQYKDSVWIETLKRLDEDESVHTDSDTLLLGSH